MSNANAWHQRLGHPSHIKIQLLMHELCLSNSKSKLASHCNICHLPKQRCLPFISHNNWSANPFDLVHIDIWGPFHVPTPKGHMYFLTIVDDCTQATWAYLLHVKNDVQTTFPNFFKLVHTQYNTTIKFVRADNAPELAFHELVSSKGVFPFHS